MNKQRIKKLKEEEKRLLDKIDSLNNDMFLIYGYIYGYSRQLEEVRQQLKK